jgi:hypothetical protein
MIRVRLKGDFSKTTGYLSGLKNAIQKINLDNYGRQGVAALASATPINTGQTANSWYYTVQRNGYSASIIFRNSNIQNDIPIAIILQYGHGTRNGGYVEGIDYINPALRPIFDKISDDAWKEVISL